MKSSVRYASNRSCPLIVTDIQSCLKTPQINTGRSWFAYTEWIWYVSTSTGIEFANWATEGWVVTCWNNQIVGAWISALPRSIVLADRVFFKTVRLPLMRRYLAGVAGSPFSNRSWFMFSPYHSSFCRHFFFRNSNTGWNRQWPLVGCLKYVVLDTVFRFTRRAAWVACLGKFCYFLLLSVLCSSVFKPNLEFKWEQ